MHRIAHLALILSVALAASTAVAAAPPQAPAAKSAKAKAAAKAEPVTPTAHVVEYAELEDHVGDTIIVETTLDTVRRGKLVRYTNPGLTLQLGPEDGSIELEIPHETVRNVSVVASDAAPAGKDGQDGNSAKKN